MDPLPPPRSWLGVAATAQDRTVLDWMDADVVATGPASEALSGLHLAFNNTRVGGRDDRGRLHLVWSDGSTVTHGSLESGGSWRTNAVATGMGRVSRPTLAVLGDGTLVVAFGASERSVSWAYAATSGDGGETWSKPRPVSSGPAESVALVARPRSGAVAAWHARSGRVEAAAFDGRDWSRPVPLEGQGDGADVTLGISGDLAVACWEEAVDRGSPKKSLRFATSRDGGVTWSEPGDLAIEGAGVPGSLGDACLARDGEGGLLLGFQGAMGVYLARSAPGELRFRLVERLGSGLFAHVEGGPAVVAFAWEEFTSRNMRNDAAKSVGLALSTDGGITFDGPNAMPGSGDARGRIQAAVLVSTEWLDVVWIEREDDRTRLLHRAAWIGK